MKARGVRFTDKQWELVQRYANEFDMSASEVLRMIVDMFFGVKREEQK